MKSVIFSGLSVLLMSAATAPIVQAETVAIHSNNSDNILVSQASTSTLKSGDFVSGNHPTSGGVRIFSENGKKYLEFEDNFKTDAGPDLFVILHVSDDVIGSTAAPTHSIEEGDYVNLASLQEVSGTQRYEIPDTVELDKYGSVAVWCRQFNVTFGAAQLSK